MSADLDRALGLVWQAPPKTVRDAMRKLPALQPLAAHGRSARTRRVQPKDVRSISSGLLAAPTSRIEVFSFDWADVTLRVDPGRNPHVHRIEVRLWYRDPSARVTDVALLDDDHVLEFGEISDGGRLVFEEVLGRGWQIELRCNGQCPLQVRWESQ